MEDEQENLAPPPRAASRARARRSSAVNAISDSEAEQSELEEESESASLMSRKSGDGGRAQRYATRVDALSAMMGATDSVAAKV